MRLKLKDDNEEWFEDLDNISRTATQFFEHIYSTSHPTTIEVVLEVIGSIGCECDWCDECDSNSYLHTRWSPPHLDADQQICTQQRHLAHTICPIPPIFTKHLIWSLECVNVACWLFKITLLTVLYPFKPVS